MKIKLDENLPERLVTGLGELGHDVDTVRAEHLTGRPDDEVREAAFLSHMIWTSPTSVSTRPGRTEDYYCCVSRSLAAMPWSLEWRCFSRLRMTTSGRAAR